MMPRIALAGRRSALRAAAAVALGALAPALRGAGPARDRGADAPRASGSRSTDGSTPPRAGRPPARKFQRRDDGRALGAGAAAGARARSARSSSATVARPRASTKSLPGLRPTATTRSCVFRSSFAKQAGAQETVTLERDAGGTLARGRLRDRLTPAAPSPIVAETVALSQVRLPRLRRRGELESRRSRSSSARSAAPSRRRSSTRDGAIVEHDLAAALRGLGDDARGWQAETAAGQVPELQRDLGAQSRAAGAELRVLRLGAARAVRGDEARVPPGERAAVQGQPRPTRATASARGTASSGSRPTR